jgi:[ribosomal protein S18]-alanine N-acetyltransferase
VKARKHQHGNATPPIRIRRATRRDFDGITRIERESFAHEAEAFNPRQVRGLLANPRAIVHVADAGGRVAGWAVSLLRAHGKGKSGRLYALAVHPAWQGHGLGKRLLRRAIGELRRRGVRRVYLEVRTGNQAAIALYQRHGFEHHAALPHYYARGVHGVRMVLDSTKRRSARVPRVGLLTRV